MATLRQMQREQQAQYNAMREQQAVSETKKVETTVKLLETVLSRRVSYPLPAFQFASLLKPEPMPTFDAKGLDSAEAKPRIESFLPDPPSLLTNVIPIFKNRYDHAVDKANQEFQSALELWRAREAKREENLALLQHEYDQSCKSVESKNAADRANVERFQHDCAEGLTAAVTRYFSLILENDKPLGTSALPFRVAYVKESRQLVVEVNVPSKDIVPDVAGYRYVKKSDEISPVKRTASSAKEIYTAFSAQLALRVLYVACYGDSINAVDTVVLSCFVKTIDPATGKEIRPCIISASVSKTAFTSLQLGKVDPVACLKGLHAQVSRSPHELEPVKPLVDFNMVDPRFIKETDVLAALDQRPNIADLSPGEFESLITNLFAKMGLETRLTRPSRDGGVDCVAWDMRPVVGGKVVIQAKRYRHTVGVSAVRDLYGTLMNEGATKGILVTTSGYGKAAFEFANNKPLELINGSNLLYLLKEHAAIDAKIEFPADWVDPAEDAIEA